MVKKFKQDKTGLLEAFGGSILIMIVYIIAALIFAPSDWEVSGTEAFAQSILGVWFGSAIIIMFVLILRRQSVQLHEKELWILKGKNVKHQVSLDQLIEPFQVTSGYGRNKQTHSFVVIEEAKIGFDGFSPARFAAMIHEIHDYQAGVWPKNQSLVKGIKHERISIFK